eukprot:7380164-Prymnesium_polylepis.1
MHTQDTSLESCSSLVSRSRLVVRVSLPCVSYQSSPHHSTISERAGRELLSQAAFEASRGPVTIDGGQLLAVRGAPADRWVRSAR